MVKRAAKVINKAQVIHLLNVSFYKWLISKTKHSQALLWCQHYLSFNMITDMVKTTNHSVSGEAYYTRYPRACVHLPCNVFIVGVSGGALVNIVPTKACVPHNECRITLQQPRSSIWKPRWRYLSSVSYSVLLVYGPKYWEIRRDTQIWDSYPIKTISWKATIFSIYSVCVCWVGDGELQLHTAVYTSLSCQHYSFQEIFTSFLLQKCTFVIHTAHCHNESPLNTSPGTVTLKV